MPEATVAVSKEAVEAVLDEVRPMLRMDGGDCEVVSVDVDAGAVTLRLLGACDGCPLSMRTLKSGIERIVREKVPGVHRVTTVDDAGAAGTAAV